jgi:hypothetical protein
MSFYTPTGRISWRTWWRYLAGPALWALLAVCISQIGPSWSAHLGHGQAGTWTVTRIACERDNHGCSDLGRFVSADGSDVRSDVQISGGSSLRVGRSLRAIDAGGAKVYPVGGGHGWWAYPAATALLAVPCAVWIWTFPIAVLRRRSARKSARFTAAK